MRLAVVADIHGNLPALEAVIADIERRDVDLVVNLGDCVSGPLWPRETLERLRELGWPTVRGNHDRAVGLTSRETLGKSDRYSFDAIDPEGRAWLADLPLRLTLDGGTLAFHASPTDDTAYLLEDQHGPDLVPAAAATVAARLGGTTAELILTAHSHLPRFIQLPDGPAILNPGSVGCPAYDDDTTAPPHMSEAGSPAARYAIVDFTFRGPAISLLALPYDHATAVARAEANSRADWAYALRTGFTLYGRDLVR